MKDLRITPQFAVVGIDETEFYDEDFVTRAGGKIINAYLYDTKGFTYCCSTTPSYYLTYLYSFAPNVSDENYEEVMDELENDGDMDGYYNASFIDNIKDYHVISSKDVKGWKDFIKENKEELSKDEIYYKYRNEAIENAHSDYVL